MHLTDGFVLNPSHTRQGLGVKPGHHIPMTEGELNFILQLPPPPHPGPHLAARSAVVRNTFPDMESQESNQELRPTGLRCC